MLKPATLLLVICLLSFAPMATAAPLLPPPAGAASDAAGTTAIEHTPQAETKAEVPRVVRHLEEQVRREGQYQQVLQAAPHLEALDPQNKVLHRLHALAEAIDGRLDEAELRLDAQPGPDPDNWGTLTRALIARERGQLQNARLLADQAIRLDPANAYAHNVAGTIALRAEMLELATEYFVRAVELVPDSALFQANLGATRLQAEDLEGARTALLAALDLAPDSCPALINYAALLELTGDLRAARTHLEACLASEPERPDVVGRLAEVLFGLRDFQSARSLVNRHRTSLSGADILLARIALHEGDGLAAAGYLRTAPATDEARLLRAFAAAMQDDWRRAAQMTGELLKEQQDSAPARIASMAFAISAQTPNPAAEWTDLDSGPVAATIAFLAGLQAAAAGEAEAMAAAMGDADGMLSGVSLRGMGQAQRQQLTGSPAIPHLASGLAFYAWQYFPAADRNFQKAVTADPELALARIFRALAAAQLGDNTVVLESLNAALSLAPQSYSANLLRAEYALQRGDLHTALPLMEKAIEAAKEPDLVLRAGLVAEALGDTQQARQRYEQYVDLAPDSFIGLNQLAWFLASQGESLDRALALARRADAIRPGNASILDTIGWIHYLGGDYEAAVGYLRTALEIAGWSQPLIGFHLAQAEMAAGNTAEARHLLRRITAAGPEAYEFSAAAAELLDSL